MVLWWIWQWNWLVFELSVCEGLKLLCFRYLWTHVVITMWTTCEMDVTCGLLCWITMMLVVCKLVWNTSWFQLTTGFIWVQVWWFDHSGDCFRTCALINWSVLLHITYSMDRKKVYVIPIHVFQYGRRTVKKEFICRPYYLPFIPLFLDSLAEQ